MPVTKLAPVYAGVNVRQVLNGDTFHRFAGQNAPGDLSSRNGVFILIMANPTNAPVPYALVWENAVGRKALIDSRH